VATSIVLDGAAIVQMLKPAACKNFREYARKNNVELILPTNLWKSTLRRQPTREVMYGARCCSLHQSCHRQPARGRPRVRRGCMSPTGQDYYKQPKLAVKCCHVNARSAV